MKIIKKLFYNLLFNFHKITNNLLIYRKKNKIYNKISKFLLAKN